MGSAARRMAMIAPVAVALLALIGPWHSAAGEEPLVVAAAASLRFAFQDVAERYRATPGAEITLVFGASGQLVQQIENGAPYDVFAAADDAWMQRLQRDGLIRPDSVTVFAQGRLVLLVASADAFPPGTPPPGQELRAADLALLLAPSIRRVALANPVLAPYGLAARQALQRAGLWERLEGKRLLGEDVRQVERFMTSGNVDAGLVALSIADAPAAQWRTIDARLHDPIRNTLATLRRSPHVAEAARFRALLRDDAGAATLRRYGLEPVPIRP